MRAGFMLTGCLLVLGVAPRAWAEDVPNPLSPDAIPHVLSLPVAYPPSFAFFNTVAGIELIDTAAKDPDHVRGALGAGEFPVMALSRGRPEAYVAETFYSRGTRGVRTDVVTVWDTASLKPAGEIVLTGAHRYLSVPQPNAFQLTGDDRLGLVFSFTPAGGVKVLDLAARRMLSEIPTPGCALIYPTGPHGFSSLCASGTMLTVQIGPDGQVASQSETAAFNDLADDPLFSVPGKIGAVSYFTSFKGQVQPIDLTGPRPKLLPRWSLVSPEEAKANWRPSGWQQAAGGPDGRLYVIMQPNGRDGSHKEGGPEVWVFDTASHAKVSAIKLKHPAQCIAFTGGPHPMLLASAESPDSPLMVSLDVYDPTTGTLANSSSLQAMGGPPVIYPAGR